MNQIRPDAEAGNRAQLAEEKKAQDIETLIYTIQDLKKAGTDALSEIIKLQGIADAAIAAAQKSNGQVVYYQELLLKIKLLADAKEVDSIKALLAGVDL